jgi:uncharacterized protein YoxC
MVAFNKLLNVFVFILAIATLYFAITLKEQRKVIASQRLQLAEALNTISKDVGKEVGTETLLAAIDQEKVVETVNGVVNQKDSLADCVADLGKTLGLAEDELKVAELKGLDKAVVDERMASIKDSVNAVAKRTSDVNKAVMGWSEALGKPLNLTDLSSVDNYSGSLETVSQAVAGLNERHATFVESLQETIGNIDEFEWSFSPEEFAITDRYKEAFASMASDLEKINEHLAKVNELKEVVETKNIEIEDLNTSIQDRDQTIEKLGVELTDLGNMKVKLEEQLKNYTNVAGFDPNVVGKIIGVNPEFGFVVTSLNKKETGVGQKMFIRRGDRYIGTVEVRSLTEDNSLADIMVGSEPIEVGDIIFFKSGK